MCIIGVNMIGMAAEYHGQPDSVTSTLAYINQVFIAIFTLECVLKLLALRWYYFREPWNIFDFVVVIMSIAGQSFVGSRALSFKRPLLSVDVKFCMYVCVCVCVSGTLRSNISETKGARGSVTMGSL